MPQYVLQSMIQLGQRRRGFSIVTTEGMLDAVQGLMNQLCGLLQDMSNESTL